MERLRTHPRHRSYGAGHPPVQLHRRSLCVSLERGSVSLTFVTVPDRSSHLASLVPEVGVHHLCPFPRRARPVCPALAPQEGAKGPWSALFRVSPGRGPRPRARVGEPPLHPGPRRCWAAKDGRRRREPGRGTTRRRVAPCPAGANTEKGRPHAPGPLHAAPKRPSLLEAWWKARLTRRFHRRGHTRTTTMASSLAPANGLHFLPMRPKAESAPRSGRRGTRGITAGIDHYTADSHNLHRLLSSGGGMPLGR